MPQSEPATFVELRRRFQELDPQGRPEDTALRSYTRTLFGREAGTGWDDLLKSHIVVILGEPGSGKTWELQEQARQLTAKGRFAFFIPLEPLATQSLQSVLGSEALPSFGKWLRSDGL
jgi:predicted NACHT family NTPase